MQIKSIKQKVNSVNLTLDEYKNTGYLTHNIHPYPAKFIPQIPREIISKLTDPNDWILDPFCGSGTSIVESALLGRNSVGTDINPLSCKISRAKSAKFDNHQLSLLEDFLLGLEHAHALKAVNAEPPNFFGIDKWFTETVQRDLASLLKLIREVSEPTVGNFLEVIFSAIVVRVSNQESDTRYKAISKQHPIDAVREMFCAKLMDALERTRDYSAQTPDISAKIWELDSTTEIAPVEAKFKLAVTSPPYMNSYDYYLYHKHRMRWLGLDVANTQEKEFGSRNKHNDKGLGLDVYNDAVKKSALLTRDLLTKNGIYCLIVGDAIWRGELIKMNRNYDKIFKDLGYRKEREIVFPQRKYTRSFTINMRTQHKDSYVLMYSKE